MKSIFKKTQVLLLAFTAVFAFSCSDDDDGGDPPATLNIVETAQATADLSSLVAALQAADGDLVTTLSGSTNYTVLAPTNAAFSTFLSENNFASLGDVPTDVLAQILLNHVIEGKIRSAVLTSNGAGYTNTLSTGPNDTNLSIYYNTSEGVKFNGISTVSTADVDASNGIVHIVDKVIARPNIVTFATADPNFSVLVSALTRSDVADQNYVTTLAGTTNSPFTVFAPIDTAFTDLLGELGVSELSDIDTATLVATLNHHVVAGANVQSGQIMDGMTVATLGGDVTANIDPVSITDARSRVSNVIAADVQATNGVIHAVDKVILPPAPSN
ncbi:fasciclin domain-containing protein [Spongiivirga citrea]|uniref:Fasciclin domain-containing protein n=1 Tax=Spongiivirga citrea TaxID=1481457 RepID=A0A6M0CKN1_9FLAO|nr:fasciclin domain-containing protein [Spongiivirga citrea]NER15987.1 fasciclin domain-containing protein [Spongiivirga citrea]